MSNILDNILDASPFINTMAIILSVGAIIIMFAYMLKKPNFSAIVGIAGVMLIFLGAWGVIQNIYSAFGYILLAGLVVGALKKGDSGN